VGAIDPEVPPRRPALLESGSPRAHRRDGT
jgi:hypothetical protein